MRYTRVAVALHWVIALLMIYMLIFGEDLISRRATDGSGATIHASVGAAILLLSFARLWWRIKNPPPPYPASMKPWEVKLAKGASHLFYFLMLALPISGTLSFGNFLSRAPQLSDATYFGLVPVPHLEWAIGGGLGNLHEIGGKLMWLLLAVHVLGVLKHQFIDKEGVLKRMI